MSVYRMFNVAIYPYYEIMINYLLEQRKENRSDDLNAAINLNIVLTCACYIEGLLESKLKSIVGFYKEIYCKVDMPEFKIRKPMNTFMNAMYDDLDQRISQCMGIDKYDDCFKLLLKKSLKQDELVSQQIESVQVLFQLRNVIAHGRAINAYEKITNYETQTGDEFFFGGYKKAETLLIKKGILKNRFIEAQSPDVFFTDEVADYFWKVTVSFTSAIEQFIKTGLKDIQADTFLVSLVNDYNKNNGTSFTIENFFDNIKIEITQQPKIDS